MKFQIVADTPEDVRSAIVEHLNNLVSTARSASLDSKTRRANDRATGSIATLHGLLSIWDNVEIVGKEVPVEVELCSGGAPLTDLCEKCGRMSADERGCPFDSHNL